MLLKIRLVEESVKELEEWNRQGEAFHDAWNKSAVSLIKAAQAHARYIVVERFLYAVQQGKSGMSEPVHRLLSQLCRLFLCYWLLERSGDFVLVIEISIFLPIVSYFIFSDKNIE